MTRAPHGPAPAPPRPLAARRRLAAAAAMLLGSALLLTGCGVGQGSAIAVEPGDTISVGVIPVADFAPVYIAQEEGYFAEEGLTVKTKVMQNAAAIAPSVINGQLQFGTAAVPPFLAAVQKGLPLKAVANGASVPGTTAEDPSALVAAARSGITRPRDLEGRTVAVNALSSIVHIVAAAAIKKDGGDPSKVTFIAMPFPDMVTALERGAVDAASLVEPFQVRAVAGGAQVLSRPYSEALLPEETYAAIFTAGPFAEKNPETVEKFTRALDRASLLAEEHPEKVGQVLAKYGKLPPEVFAKSEVPLYSDHLSIPAMEHAAETMHELGFLPGPVDVEGAVWP